MTDNHPTESTDQSAKPRRSRKRKVLLIVLLTPPVVILLLVLAGLWHHFHLQSLIEAEKQQIADRGEPVTVADLEAAYALPSDAVDRTDEWLSVIDELTLIVDKPEYETLPIVGDSEEQIPFPGEPWEQQAMVEQLLEEAEPALERLAGLIEEPEAVRYPIAFEQGMLMMLDDQQDLRNVARMLSLKARWQLYQGDSQGALESLLAMLQAADTLKHEPTTISQLIRISFIRMTTKTITDLLPHAGWSDAQLQQLHNELMVREYFDSYMQLALVGERVTTNELFSSQEKANKALEIDYAPLLGSDQLFYLQLMERAIAAYELPLTEAGVELKSVEDELTNQSRLQRLRHPISHIFLPGLSDLHQVCGRDTANIRSTATLIACERYHLAHGSWPKQLNDLVPQFMESVPVDPYDGQPLRYQLTPQAVVVYSIGEDLVDDGGTTISEENNFKPDIVFQLEIAQRNGHDQASMTNDQDAN